MNVADADAASYDAIDTTGGHGVCFDFPRSEGLARLMSDFGKRARSSRRSATVRPACWR